MPLLGFQSMSKKVGYSFLWDSFHLVAFLDSPSYSTPNINQRGAFMDNISVIIMVASLFICIFCVSIQYHKHITEKRKKQARLNQWFTKYSSEHSTQ